MTRQHGNVLVADPEIVIPSEGESAGWLDHFVRRWAAAVAELRLGRAVDPGDALDA